MICITRSSFKTSYNRRIHENLTSPYHNPIKFEIMNLNHYKTHDPSKLLLLFSNYLIKLVQANLCIYSYRLRFQLHISINLYITLYILILLSYLIQIVCLFKTTPLDYSYIFIYQWAFNQIHQSIHTFHQQCRACIWFSK